MLALLGCCCRVSGCAVCTDGGWHSHWLCLGQYMAGGGRAAMAKPTHLDFRRGNPPYQPFPRGVHSTPGQGSGREKRPRWGHEACTDRSFPWGLTKLGKSRCGWNPQGGFLWMLLGFSLWEQGSKERSCVNQPRRSSSSCHTQPCKARLKPEQVLLLPCPPLSHWPACSYGEARKGRVDVPQPHILACAREQRKLLERGDT